MADRKIVVIKNGGGAFATPKGFERVNTNTIFQYNQQKLVIEVDSAIGVPPGSKRKKVTDLELLVAKCTYNGKTEEALAVLKEIRDTHYEIVKELERKFKRKLDVTDLEKRFEQQRLDIEGYSRSTELTAPQMDDLFAAEGEPQVINIRYAMLKTMGIPVVKIEDPAVVGFITDSNYTKAQLMPEWEQRIESSFSRLFNQYPEHVVLVSGFRARNEYGRVTTLGRNFSTYTAGAIAVALPNTSEFYIMSDTDGVQVFDPRIIHDSQTVMRLSQRELLLFGLAGAKVVEPETVRTIIEHRRRFPIYVKHYADPSGLGTEVTPECLDEHPVIKGGGVRDISYREIVLDTEEQSKEIKELINSYDGASVRDFQLENIIGGKFRLKLEIVMKVDEKHSIEYYGDPLTDRIRQQVFSGAEFQNYCFLDLCTIGLVGEGAGYSASFLSKVNAIIAGIGFPQELSWFRDRSIIYSGGDELDVVVPKKIRDEVARKLNDHLKKINVILYGPGAIGTASLERICENYERMGLNVIGIVDSKGYVAKVGGFTKEDLQGIIQHKKGRGEFCDYKGDGVSGVCKETLNLESEEDVNKGMLDVLFRYGKGDFVFIDTTSSDHMLATLVRARELGMKIISANKLPYASKITTKYDFGKWGLRQKTNIDKLKKLFEGIYSGDVFNRATVGANLGVPDKLVQILSEDPNEIHIRCVASGTLSGVSYNANKENGLISTGFEKAIKEKWTEPVIYDDGAGQDVLRKLIIQWRIIAEHYGVSFEDCEIRHESYLKPIIDTYERITGERFDINEIASLKRDDEDEARKYIEAMRELDDAFKEYKKQQKEKTGSDVVFQYVGEIHFDKSSKIGKISIKLTPVSTTDLLGKLRECQNGFIISTDKTDYYINPGPGAGLQQTSQAIFENLEMTVAQFRGIEPQKSL